MAFIDDVRKTTENATKAKKKSERSKRAKETAAVRKARNEGRSYARKFAFEEIKEAIKKAAKDCEREYTVEVDDVTYDSGYFSHMTAETKAAMARAESELKTLVSMFKKEGLTVTPEIKYGSSRWDNDGCPTESYVVYKLKFVW